MRDESREGAERRPNWDMTPYFPEFDGAEYRTFRAALTRDVSAGLREAERVGGIREESLVDWIDLLVDAEDLSARAGHLGGYLGCLGAADARDEAIQRETAAAVAARAELQKLFVWIRSALRAVDDSIFDRLVSSPRLGDVRYFIDRLRRRAEWMMSSDLETLAADLGVDGLSAWGRLYDQVSGKLEFELEVPGQEPRRLPVSMARSLLESPDAATRRAAFTGSNRAWERVADVAAACLNAISGTRHTLYRRRGIGNFLEPALFDAGISRRTLDAMMEAVLARQELPRSYLRHKARILGRDRLGYQDLMAPLPVDSPSRIPWPEACETVLDAFGAFHPRLRELAAQAFDRSWIDYEPRPGKRPGGFCSTSTLINQSRIFITYNETLGDLGTLAHELGHAFHGALMDDLRSWARRYPMTLAETASTFAQQVMIDAVLANPESTPEERALILDSRMQDASAFLLNIPMRFQFETAVYEERLSGELGIGRLCELMLDAQRQSYGDALAADELDPWFWASKLHFYITGISFYNFPYTFGYLFSLGLFARAREEGPDFLLRYENLLRLTGSGDAEDVARKALGVDLETPEFWNASIDLIEADLEAFRSQTDAIFGASGG